jgi:AAA+ ATPase superfamily predicted ATPase
MNQIKFNPYIVGNPIKSREMFFGREDDFQFIAKKICEGRSNQIVVLCGERRSGKTSILFQILDGRLGDSFMPVLVDMQMLAGIRGDLEFFRALLRLGCAALALPGLSIEALEASAGAAGAERLFELFLASVHENAPGKIVLFLLDEYELVEAKIRDGSLSESAVHYLAGILESPFHVSFIFTGSTNLEDRKVEVWKSLLGKSIYRKISYLSRRDTFRLIEEPLRDSVSYTEAVMGAIYRLTGGQPFYTQVICQNMTDLLIEAGKSDPAQSDLERIVREIVDNPLPQMIYSWNSLGEWDHVILAALAGRLPDPDTWSDGRSVNRFIHANRIVLPFKSQRVNVLLEDSYHREFLEKGDTEIYRFKMDLFRRWIRREHSIWKAAKESGLEFRKVGRALLVGGAIAAVMIAAGALSWFFVFSRASPAPAGAPVSTPLQQAVTGITFKANRGPFRLSIDGQQALTSEGQGDPRSIVVASLNAGTHAVTASLPGGEKLTLSVEVSSERRDFNVRFPSPQTTSPGSAPPGPAPVTGGVLPASPATESPQALAVETPAEAPIAAPAAPAEQTQGILIVTTRPPGADVILDGTETGKKTPFAGSLGAGDHQVSLTLEGFKQKSFSVAVQSGKEITHDVVLEEAVGWLLFDVRPTARLSLDGTYILDTPYAKNFPVRAGRHSLTIVNEALKVNKTLTIDVKEGGTLTIREVLK